MSLSSAVAHFALVITLHLLNLQLCLASPRKAHHAPRYIATQSGNFSEPFISTISTTASTTINTVANTTISTILIQTTTTKTSRKVETSSTETITTTSVSNNHDSWNDWESSSPTTHRYALGENAPAASGGDWRPHQGGSSGASGADNSRPEDAPPHRGGNRPHGWKGLSWGDYTNSTAGDNTTSNGDWFGDDDGVPALTEEDILFIISERALAYAGFPDPDGSTWPVNDSVVITKRQSTDSSSTDYFGGENTLEKWNRLQMDRWLELYVAEVDIPGRPGRKLANSTNFFHDFWLSTGEENIVVCNSLLDTCNVAEVSDEKRFSYISRSDAYRAQYVRQVIKVWQSSNKQAYDILFGAVSTAQLQILASHTMLVQGTPPPSTSVYDMIVPAIAVVTAFVPVLAPVAGLMSAVYAVAKAITKREDIENVTWADSGMNHTDAFEALWKRQNPPETDTIKDIQERLAKLEFKKPKTWLEEQKDPIANTGKGLDAAAKIILAIKGLNPQLPRSTISSWDVFDASVLQALLVFPQSILTSFELNIKTYWPQETTNAAGTTTLSSGMRPFLLNGRWSLAEAHKEAPSVSAAKVKKFLDAVILMQYVQQQALYYWVQNFASASACATARQEAIDKRWLAVDGWYNCERLTNGQYQLQYTRKPTTNRGPAQLTPRGDYSPFGDVVAIEAAPTGYYCYVQERSGNIFARTGFEQNTAGLNKWNDGILAALHYDFNMNDVFSASRACQAAIGDPFTQNASPRDAFYPSMRLHDDSTGDDENEILSGQLPLCLFNVPIFEVGRTELDTWCKNHIGSMNSRSWSKDDDNCGEKLELWAIQSDTKLCGSNQGSYFPKRDSRPGCSLHEHGVYTVYCSQQDYEYLAAEH